MKKKNGFTLVELLVVIALMLSILGISVVSFITISNNKKEDAWEEVKSQIEVAAQQYFSSNEYLFEGLGENLNGTISVGTLVDNDYLNVVTNPTTGKLISKCSVVNVAKNGSKYNAVFDNNSITSDKSSCDTHYILISESGGPSINAIVQGKKGNGLWYTSSATVNNYVNDNNNGDIVKVGIYDEISKQISKELNKNNNSINVYGDFDTYRSDITITRTCYAAENVNNKKAYTCIELGVDTNYPTVTVKTDNENWTNQNVNYTYSASDNMKLSSLVGYWNANNKNESVANTNDCSWNESSKSYGNNNCKGNNSSNKISVSAKEYNQTSYFSAQGYRKIKFKACDEAGNCSYSDEAIARIDKTAPTLEIKSYMSKKLDDINGYGKIKDKKTDNYNENWYSGYVGLKATANDTLTNTTMTYNRKKGSVGGSGEQNETINSDSEGIATRYDWSEAQGISIYTFQACDEAENCSSQTKNVKLDRTAPTLEIKSYMSKKLDDINGYGKIKDKNPNNYNENWYSGYVGLKATANDTLTNTTMTYNRKKGSVGGSGEKNETINSDSEGIATRYDWSEAQGISIYTFQACDEAENCSSQTIKNVKLDRTPPTITLNGYFGKNSDIDEIANFNTLNNYISNNKITSLNNNSTLSFDKSFALKANFSDSHSGVKEKNCTDSRQYDDFKTYRRVLSTYVGNVTFKCDAEDNAGNVATQANYSVSRQGTCSQFANATESNIGTYVTVEISSIKNISSYGKTLSNTGTSGTETTFIFKSNYNDVKIHSDISAGYGDFDSTGNHAGWNTNGTLKTQTKQTWCDPEYDCPSGIQYVVACAKVTCGSTNKKVCYKVDLSKYYNNNSDYGSFSNVSNP